MLLLTPGPTPVPEFVRTAMAGETLHHRTPEFEAIFASARELSLKLFGMPEILFLASSGTGAMEAAAINLCRSRALTINSGKFGQRFTQIAEAYGKNPVELEYEWDTPASVADVEKALADNPDIDALFVQACESAGGLRHPVEEIAAAAKAIRPELMVVVDGITAVGVETLDTRQIDCLITGSQKALMLPPGLAIVGLSHQAVERIEAGGAGYYFNLARELKSQRKNTTAYTAATTLIIGLQTMLGHLFDTGLELHYVQTLRRHAAMDAAVKALGLSVFPQTPAPAMCAVVHDNADGIRKILKTRHGVNIAGGQDHMKGRLFRINNMGLVEPAQLTWALTAVELAMEELGERPFDGTAARVFNERYAKEG